MQTPLARFIVKVLLWLPPAFVVWYLAAPILVFPARLIVALVAGTAFGDLVSQVDQSGATIVFATTLKPGQSSERSAAIVVEINALLYAFGLPLYAALTVAARAARWQWKVALGYACVLPVIAFGVLADFLKNVAITAGPMVASQTGFTAWQREAIAFAFQSGSLILPTVVPAVVFLLAHRAFVVELRGG